MGRKFTYLGVVAVLVALMQTGAGAQGPGRPPGGERTDFALFDGTDPSNGETGFACGAKRGGSDQPVTFTYFVTVSNWSSSVKVLRVLYADGVEMARYQVPPGTSFSFSQAAGGTRDVDDLIRIFAEGPAPSGLAGSMSMLTQAAAHPHPALDNFCVTLTTPMP